jgi:hypothetical protein
MIRLTCSLAFATAWLADAVFLYALAEARTGSVLNRLFAVILLASAAAAILFAVAPMLRRVVERECARTLGWWAARRIERDSRRAAPPAGLATPSH